MKAVAQGGRFDGREFEAKARQQLQSFWRDEGEKYEEEHVYVNTKEEDKKGRVIFQRWDDDVHGRLQDRKDRK